MLSEGSVGQQSVSATSRPLRLTPDGSLVAAAGQGDWYEASRNGRLYEVTNGFAGVTSAAAWLTPVAAAAATCLSLWNSSSNMALAVHEVTIALLSGTVEAGLYTINVHYNCTAISATPNAIHRNLNLSQVNPGTAPIGVGRGFSNTAITAGLVGYDGPVIGVTPAVVGGKTVRDFRGGLIVAPYAMITIGAPTNGTSAVIGASIVYAEVDLV